MSGQSKSPACYLRWTVQKVADRMYAVAATIDGIEYDFVGNYKSIRDAQKAYILSATFWTVQRK